MRAAIDASCWIVREPQAITKCALKRIDHEVLWLALHLDVDEIVASATASKLRRRCEQWSADARRLRQPP